MLGRRNSRRFGEVEARLRAERPAPREELVRALARRIDTRPTGVPRLALAGSLTALLLVALGSVGGISYAASAMTDALVVVKKAVAPSAGQGTIAVSGLTAGGDQYRPGFGFGDPNHNHTGPPGLGRPGGEAAPPLRSQAVGSLARRVAAALTLSEQATLFISVLDRNAKPLLLTQSSKRGGSTVGQGIKGPQTKFIRYTVLVPRTIPLRLRIPSNLLRAGQTYRIRVVAIDPNGNRSTIIIPFTA